MAFIRTLLIILEAACSLALIGLILLQKSKSEGLGMAFGGGGNDSLFGARAGNVLTKATVGIGIAFLVNTLILGMLFAGSANESLMDSADAPAAVPMAQPSAVPMDQPADISVVPEIPVAPAE
jgi:preprotein translocase subunit SecG